MSSVEESAHRSSDSAHRSGPGGDEAVTNTVTIPLLMLAPVLGEIAAAWWQMILPRYTMHVRGHRLGERVRVLRFYTRRGRDRAMHAYLDAHRRVYRYWHSGIPIT